jgi:phosphatidate cytidylyltransferase
MTQTAAKKSDLGVRAASAVVMIALAGTALWLGGWVWTAFVAAIGLGVLWEWWTLVCGFVRTTAGRVLWLIVGLVYIGIAAGLIAILGNNNVTGTSAFGGFVLPILGAVVATDVFAYFAGRTFGGPKIAPLISPSKTWSGLIGGIAGASLLTYFAFAAFLLDYMNPVFESIGIGAAIAITAQSGDFFESWMKRRAMVKDSGKLIPGHGGLFDRLDGLLAVSFVIGLYIVIALAGSSDL